MVSLIPVAAWSSRNQSQNGVRSVMETTNPRISADGVLVKSPRCHAPLHAGHRVTPAPSMESTLCHNRKAGGYWIARLKRAMTPKRLLKTSSFTTWDRQNCRARRHLVSSRAFLRKTDGG